MNTKAKKRINIVDIIILVALIVLSGAVIFGFVKGIGTSGERTSVRYIIEVEPIDSDFVSKVTEGNGVYDHTTSQRIGTVRAVSSAQAYYKSFDAKGSPTSSPMEGSSTLYITVEADAVRSDAGYSVGSTVLSIGRRLELRFPGLYVDGKCVSIEALD